ncbi:hypothetical protein Emag_001789 [Eimeria magna]
MVILDEGQKIKNPHAAITLAVKRVSHLIAAAAAAAATTTAATAAAAVSCHTALSGFVGV